MKTWRPAMMLGRLSSGLQADHGNLIHAVVKKKVKRPPCPFNDWGKKEIPNDDYETEVSFCGKRPGRKSVGWSSAENQSPTCERCLKKIEKEK